MLDSARYVLSRLVLLLELTDNLILILTIIKIQQEKDRIALQEKLERDRIEREEKQAQRQVFI